MFFFRRPLAEAGSFCVRCRQAISLCASLRVSAESAQAIEIVGVAVGSTEQDLGIQGDGCRWGGSMTAVQGVSGRSLSHAER